MKKRTIIVILGLWVALLPFLGLPGSWKKVILIVTGLAISIVASTRKKKTFQSASQVSSQSVSPSA